MAVENTLSAMYAQQVADIQANHTACVGILWGVY